MKTPPAPKAMILFTPALGIRGSYYQPLQPYFEQLGYLFRINELRGTNGRPPGRKFDFGYAELINEDMKGQVEQLKSLHGDVPLVLAGNSLGGQLSVLFAAKYPDLVAGLLLVATPSPYWKYYDLKRSLALRASAWVIPLSGVLLGYFPGTVLGIGGREARGVMRDWKALALHDRFAVAGDDFDFEAALASLVVPVLSIRDTTDALAPEGAVNAILRRLVSAPLERKEISGFGHTRWARDPVHALVDVVPWLATLA